MPALLPCVYILYLLYTGGSMDISSVLHDPELGSVSFTVERTACTRSRDGTVSRSVTGQAAGCIHPGTAEMLKLLPGEEKNESYIGV